MTIRNGRFPCWNDCPWHARQCGWNWRRRRSTCPAARSDGPLVRTRPFDGCERRHRRVQSCCVEGWRTSSTWPRSSNCSLRRTWPAHRAVRRPAPDPHPWYRRRSGFLACEPLVAVRHEGVRRSTAARRILRRFGTHAERRDEQVTPCRSFIVPLKQVPHFHVGQRGRSSAWPISPNRAIWSCEPLELGWFGEGHHTPRSRFGQAKTRENRLVAFGQVPTYRPAHHARTSFQGADGAGSIAFFGSSGAALDASSFNRAVWISGWSD